MHLTQPPSCAQVANLNEEEWVKGTFYEAAKRRKAAAGKKTVVAAAGDS